MRQNAVAGLFLPPRGGSRMHRARERAEGRHCHLDCTSIHDVQSLGGIGSSEDSHPLTQGIHPQDQTAQLVGPRGNSREATTAPSRQSSHLGHGKTLPLDPGPQSLFLNGRKLQLPASPSRSPLVPV